MPTDDRVTLYPNRHDRLRAVRAGTTIPASISRGAFDQIVDLKTRGYSFTEIARDVPEVLSPAGAHVAFRQALDAMQPVTFCASDPRRPFDGRPGAPAWTPAGSTLVDTLRPLERPSKEECERIITTELRAAGVADGCKCWTRDKHGTIILAGNLWCPLCNNPKST